MVDWRTKIMPAKAKKSADENARIDFVDALEGIEPRHIWQADIEQHGVLVIDAKGMVHSANPASRRLLATSKDGRAHLNAYLDDYAFLLAALLGVVLALAELPVLTGRPSSITARATSTR